MTQALDWTLETAGSQPRPAHWGIQQSNNQNQHARMVKAGSLGAQGAPDPTRGVGRMSWRTGELAMGLQERPGRIIACSLSKGLVPPGLQMGRPGP